MPLPAPGTLNPALLVATTNADDFSAVARAHATEWEAFKQQYGLAAGVAILDAEGRLPAAYLFAAPILAALAGQAGEGSNLDADLLDGREGEAYLLADGSRPVSLVDGDIFTVSKDTEETDAAHTVLSVRASAAGRDVGYGAAIALRASNAAGTITTAGRVSAAWDVATDTDEDSRLTLETMVDGALTAGVSVHGGVIEMLAVGNPSGIAPAGHCWLWFDDHAGTLNIRPGTGDPDITVGTSAGVPSHDHDSLYLRLDGGSGMAGQLDLGPNTILSSSLASPPDPPATAGDVIIYAEGGALKTKNSAGTVVTVSSSPSLHGDFPDLSGNHHPQYLLVQPAADVVINSAGEDHDFAFRDATGEPLLSLDAGDAAVSIGGAVTDDSARLFVEASAERAGIRALVVGGTGVGVTVAEDGLGLDVDVLGSGGCARLVRVGAEPDQVAVVSITESTAAANTGALEVNHPGGSGFVAQLTSNANSALLVGVAELVVNDDAAAYAFRVEGGTAANLLRTIPASDVVTVNHASLATGRFNVDGGVLDAIFARTSEAGKAAIHVEGNASATGLLAVSSAGLALDAQTDTGTAAYFHRNTAAASAALCALGASSATDSGPLLRIIGGGVGRAVEYEDAGVYTFGVLSSAGASARCGILEFRVLGESDTIPAAAENYARVFFRAGDMWTNIEGVERVVGSGAGGGVVLAENGAERRPDHIEAELTTTAAAAKVSMPVAVPAGSIIERVVTRNLTQVVGGYDVGHAGDRSAYCSGVTGDNDGTNSTAPFTPNVPVNGTDVTVDLWSNNPGGFATSNARIAVTVFFLRTTPPAEE